MEPIRQCHDPVEESQHPERGATATEYAALLALIALVVALGIAAFGTALGNYFGTATASVKTILGIP